MRVEKKPEEKKIEPFVAPQPLGKVIFLAVLVVASTALFWLAWHFALNTGLNFILATRNVAVVVVNLLAFCLMFSFLAVAEVAVTNKVVVLAMTLAAAATIFLFFPLSLWVWVGFLLMALSFFYWRREIRLDGETRNRFIPQRIVNSGLKTAVSLILLSACFAYYGQVVSQPDAKSQIADSLANSGAKAAQNILSLYYKDKYSPHMSLDDFIANISFSLVPDANLKSGQADLDKIVTQSLSAAQKDLVVQSRINFLKTFKIEASGTEEMQSVIKKIVRKNIDQYVNPYIKFIPALIALSLYFILSIFSFIYRELIKSISFLLFHILVWLKFLKVKKIQIEAEKIVLSD